LASETDEQLLRSFGNIFGDLVDFGKQQKCCSSAFLFVLNIGRSVPFDGRLAE